MLESRARSRRLGLCGLLLFAALGGAGAQEAAATELAALRLEALPEMQQLKRGDSLFDQLATDLSLYYRARSKRSALPSLTLVRYRVKEGESLYSIAARLNLPHSTIASLNRLQNPSLLLAGRLIVIPNLPGIYLPLAPETQLEQLLAQRLLPRAELALELRYHSGERLEEFRYFPSEDYSPKERLAFLGSLFRQPLDSYRLSSAFGPRRNPISGQMVQHNGVDLVAPYGTPVKASADGTVLEIGFDPVYGSFVIIDHSSGYESVYSHLSKTTVKKGQRLSSGEVLGHVGTSGQTTGAHLHFEIHYNGTPRDPMGLIRN